MELTREQTRAKTSCPTCGAKQFEPCFQRKGSKKRKATNHWDRIKLAAKLEKKEAPKSTMGKCAQSHKSDSFYSSWAWKQARYEALRIHGHRCQCCGWQPRDTPHGHLVVDHIKPRRRFPDLELCVDNLQVLCNDCNMGKGAVHQDDYRTLEDWFGNLLRE